jgi:chromate transport protein ChrA
MPGPMFNLSVYMGTISAKSIVGGLCAFCGLYLPCFLFVSFALPVWEKYRNVHYIRKFITGVCCVSVGLILCTCLILYQTATHHQSFPFYYGLIILVCFTLLHDGVSIVRVLVIGECLYLIVEAFIYLPS